MRDASMPFSVTRYALALTARCAARSAIALAFLPFGAGVAAAFEPTRTAVASAERWRLRATSSRQAFASLSTRAGRLVSRSKVIEQSVWVLGTGGGGGASTLT